MGRARAWDAEEGEGEGGRSEWWCRESCKAASMMAMREEPAGEACGGAKEPEGDVPEGAWEEAFTAESASCMLAMRESFFPSARPLSISACRAAR